MKKDLQKSRIEDWKSKKAGWIWDMVTASSQGVGHQAGMQNGDDPGPHPDKCFLLK